MDQSQSLKLTQSYKNLVFLPLEKLLADYLGEACRN